MYNFQKKKYKKKIYKRRSERKKVFFFAPPTCAHDARDARVTRIRVRTYIRVCMCITCMTNCDRSDDRSSDSTRHA